jgi:hypothetical protein
MEEVIFAPQLLRDGLLDVQSPHGNAFIGRALGRELRICQKDAGSGPYVGNNRAQLETSSNKRVQEISHVSEIIVSKYLSWQVRKNYFINRSNCSSSLLRFNRLEQDKRSARNSFRIGVHH